jgi:hypothetical protein
VGELGKLVNEEALAGPRQPGDEDRPRPLGEADQGRVQIRGRIKEQHRESPGGIVADFLTCAGGADRSAVIATTGTATNARFVDGMAVFVRPIAGAMAEASLGGQRMTYVPR